ncbi:hypothetical protein VTJ49DRAFT_6625 [Mycothermus thermophilus]|uniref:Uncharacterized protein n=1 Tax=Humicola insolens TaxID=85995 RepID=A0ABR3VJM2_HUMIN
MASKFWPRAGNPGILHHFTETLVTFEFTTGTRPQPNSILFIGGLGDGLATTSYLADVVTALQPTSWSLFSPTLSSAYTAWGFSHLDRDTDEIASCIRHIQDYKAAKYGSPGRIVLMGHSTGSQCVLHYLSRPNPHTSTPSFDKGLEHVLRPKLDGAIMQAPVSDREALKWVVKEGFLGRTPEEMKESFDELVRLAREGLKNEDPTADCMLPIPLTRQFGYPGNTPISCRRWLSLASPDSPRSPGEDDMFSSDLGDEQIARTWGMVGPRGLLGFKLMVLMSGRDQAVPGWVDKEKLLARWRDAADRGGAYKVWDRERSGLIPNASHALSDDDQAEPRQFLCRRILDYLDELESSL